MINIFTRKFFGLTCSASGRIKLLNFVYFSRMKFFGGQPSLHCNSSYFFVGWSDLLACGTIRNGKDRFLEINYFKNQILGLGPFPFLKFADVLTVRTPQESSYHKEYGAYLAFLLRLHSATRWLICGT